MFNNMDQRLDFNSLKEKYKRLTGNENDLVIDFKDLVIKEIQSYINEAFFYAFKEDYVFMCIEDLWNKLLENEYLEEFKNVEVEFLIANLYNYISSVLNKVISFIHDFSKNTGEFINYNYLLNFKLDIFSCLELFKEEFIEASNLEFLEEDYKNLKKSIISKLDNLSLGELDKLNKLL